jgi:hypothetical protein
MDTAALRYLFFGDENGSDSEGAALNPYVEWMRASLDSNISEQSLMRQLDQIERWMYLENVWYYAILKFVDQLNLYPIFLEYVSRRDAQWHGQDFPDEEAQTLMKRVFFPDFSN